MSLSLEKICERAMKLAGRGDKPSSDDYNEAIETASMILTNWSSNHGVALWDILKSSSSIEAGELLNHNAQGYICIKSHTSSPENEPGIGNDTDLYWRETDLTSSNIWVSGLYYVTTKVISFEDPQLYSVSNVTCEIDGSVSDIELVSKQAFLKLPEYDLGTPNRAYLDKNSGDVVLYLYPQPNENAEIKYYQCNNPIPLEGVNSEVIMGDNWQQALIYTLAVEMGMLYNAPPDTIAMLISRAKKEFRACLGTAKAEVDRCFVKSTY